MFDFVRFCQDHRIKIVNSGKDVTRGWVGVACPFCIAGDSGFHLGFNVRSQALHCWKCGDHSHLEFIRRILTCSWPEADRTLMEYAGRSSLGMRFVGKSERNYAQWVQLPKESLNAREISYLERRGINAQQIQKDYDLRSGGILDPLWKFRIVLPIQTVSGQIVSAVGRAILDTMEPRYWGLPIEKSIQDWHDQLFGWNRMDTKTSSVGIVEGPFDQFLLGSGWLATFGTQLSPSQIYALSRFERVAIAFDSDDPGKRAAEHISVKLLSLGVREVEIIELEHGKDPGETTSEELEELRSLII